MSHSTRTTYILEHHDQNDGSITYEIWLYNPEPTRRIVAANDFHYGDLTDVDRHVRPDMQLIAKALNFYDDKLHQDRLRKEQNRDHKANPPASPLPKRPSRR